MAAPAPAEEPASVDAVIIGAGAAGLSLACHLVAAGWGDRRVLLVDDGAVDPEHRAWAYWSRGDLLLDADAGPPAERLRVRGPHLDRVLDLAPTGLGYRTITGATLEAATARRLATAPGFARLRARATDVAEDDDGARVALAPVTAALPDDATSEPPPPQVRARWVFDSTGVATPGSVPRPWAHLEVLGDHVTADTDAVDPATPTLMDFRTPQDDGLAFLYVLPRSARAALVEHTRFAVGRRPAADPADDAVTTARARAALDDAERALPAAVRPGPAELGRIPLATDPPARPSAHVIPIGPPAGMVKASTGYAWTRIQRHSAALADSLVRTGHPFDVPPLRARHRALDALLLEVVRDEPAAALRVFERLFARNTPTRILGFLDEDTSPADELALILTLPPAPFLRALGRRARRRLQRRPST